MRLIRLRFLLFLLIHNAHPLVGKLATNKLHLKRRKVKPKPPEVPGHAAKDTATVLIRGIYPESFHLYVEDVDEATGEETGVDYQIPFYCVKNIRPRPG